MYEGGPYGEGLWQGCQGVGVNGKQYGLEVFQIVCSYFVDRQWLLAGHGVKRLWLHVLREQFYKNNEPRF